MVMDENERYELVCKAQFAQLNHKMDRLFTLLMDGSNGMPPFTVRLDRAERAIKALLWLNATSACAFIAAALRLWLVKGGGAA